MSNPSEDPGIAHDHARDRDHNLPDDGAPPTPPARTLPGPVVLSPADFAQWEVTRRDAEIADRDVRIATLERERAQTRLATILGRYGVAGGKVTVTDRTTPEHAAGTVLDAATRQPLRRVAPSK